MDNAVAALKDQPPGIPTLNGRSFHIFQASRVKNMASMTATDWLMGLFEPDKDYAFMDLDQTVRSHGTTVQIDSTVVTKTHILDLMMLFKQYRAKFDEIFFVVSNRGTQDRSACEYDNVLCLEHEEVLFSQNQDMKRVAINLTNRFSKRFEFFFGANSEYFGEDRVEAAAQRMTRMAKAVDDIANQPYF